MSDPAWIAGAVQDIKDCMLYRTGDRWERGMLALKRLLAHNDELRTLLADVLGGYSGLAVDKNLREMPRTHVDAANVLARQEPPETK